MIEVRNLSKLYNDRVAVNAINFTVKRGEILGFLGPNGAGKSTTMKILSGFISASSGAAIVNGHDVQKEPMQAKASIGYLPENPPVYLSMYVEDYLRFVASLHGVEKTKVSAAVNEAMGQCGIRDVRGRIIGNLSKGYRQRVGLAQAIVHRPPVLILDEPTVGLDPKQIIEIRNLIRSLAGQHTVILSTHILPEVQATCQRVVVIDHGKIVAEDTLEGISLRQQGNIRLHLILQKNPAALFGKIRNLTGIAKVEAHPEQSSASEHHISVECSKGHDVRSELAEVLVLEKLGLLSLTTERLSLEDAFVRLITTEEAK